MLYERDYRVLTNEETEELQKAEVFLAQNTGDFGMTTAAVREKYHDLRPGASYYFKSYFPNNYLNLDSLKDKAALHKIETEFLALLESNISERDILNFINKNRYFNLIASLFNSGYTFGHHDAYLFKEFELPSTYKADYLLIGKNSHGYHFIFVELENPSGSISNKDGSFGQTLRKGINQVKSWDKWLQGNFHSLDLVFNKSKNQERELPKEFKTLDLTRINYVVIAGRRADFNEETYNEKRRLLQNEKIQVLHYDNLIDSFRELQTRDNY